MKHWKTLISAWGGAQDSAPKLSKGVQGAFKYFGTCGGSVKHIMVLGEPELLMD